MQAFADWNVREKLDEGSLSLSVYVLWIVGLCLSGLTIFYFWPTQVPPLTLDATGYGGFALLHRIDEAGNACPSMHVAVAIFTAVRVDEVLHSTRAPRLLRLLNVAWFILIAYSTLAIKQHVTPDVAAGALLGMIFALASLRWRPRAVANQVVEPERDINFAKR